MLNDYPEVRRIFAWASIEGVSLNYSYGGKPATVRVVVITGGATSLHPEPIAQREADEEREQDAKTSLKCRIDGNDPIRLYHELLEKVLSSS